MRRQSLVLLVLAACEGGQSPPGGDGGGTNQSRTTGQFCLSADGVSFDGPHDFVVDRPVHVRFVAADCLSSSCTVDETASCEVRDATASSFEVLGAASWRDTSGDNACTGDCQILDATCASRTLGSGSFVFVFGGDSINLAIPSASSDPICIEN